jgi:nucleotide-binding universal stress UspA family protein
MTNVLIAYDGSDAAGAATAAAGALFGGADATVATVHPPPPTLEAGALARAALPDDVIREGIERMRADAEERARTTAAEGVEHAQAAGLRATPAILTGLSAWRTLRSSARDKDADVVACGTRGEGPLKRMLLGCTASSLLHHADRPLLLTPAGDAKLDGPVMVGYDGSEGARGALRFAAEHLPGRLLLVAHAWRSPVRHTIRGHALVHSGVDRLEEYADTVDEIWAQEADEVAQDGATYARELGLDARAIAPESGHGDWQTLLAGAREAGAAAILVGSRGVGAVASTVLGSVASGLAHAAAIPVLIVPDAASATPPEAPEPKG